jgi:bifunctional non-homologous end joining protein LigD
MFLSMARALSAVSSVGTSPDGGRACGVEISHPTRVVFPATGATKLDVARYYESIANWMLPHVLDRPLTLVRCPTGAGRGVKDVDCFFMKHSKLWAPTPLRRVRIREKTKIGEYLIADSAAALIGLVQMGVLEVHTWNSRFADVEPPDRIVIDIDPGARVTWPRVVEAARLVRELLRSLDLESFVKTTGGRGVHVVAPVTPRTTWAECLTFARAVAETLARHAPQTFTTAFAKAGRDDRLLVDYLRNNRTNTSIAPFSTRAKPDAPVAVPIEWRELTPTRTPDRFTMQTVLRRVAKLRADPWKEYWTTRQEIPKGAIAALERL